MRCNIGFFSDPRQYAAAVRINLNAGIYFVEVREGNNVAIQKVSVQ